jgi:hypothetical protein
MRIHLPSGINHDNTGVLLICWWYIAFTGSAPGIGPEPKFLFDKASSNRAIIRIARRVLFAN